MEKWKLTGRTTSAQRSVHWTVRMAECLTGVWQGVCQGCGGVKREWRCVVGCGGLWKGEGDCGGISKGIPVFVGVLQEVARCGGVWWDVARCGEMWQDVARSGEMWRGVAGCVWMFRNERVWEREKESEGNILYCRPENVYTAFAEDNFWKALGTGMWRGLYSKYNSRGPSCWEYCTLQ